MRGCVRTYARPSSVPRRIDGRSNSSSRKKSLRAHREEPEQDGEEADRVHEEADAGAGEAVDDARGCGAEDARRVEEARVERDRVRERVAPDHPVGELLPRRHVEHEHEAVGERDRIEHPRLREAAECDPRQRDSP